MSVTDIVEKIAADAEAQAARILADAATQVTEIEQGAERQKAALQNEWEQKREVAVSRVRQTIVAQARHLAQQRVQTAKRKAVDAALEAAYEALRQEPQAAYEARYSALLSALTLDGAVETVWAPVQRQESTVAILGACGIAGVTVEVDDAIDAGLVVRAGARRYDITLYRVFTAKRPELEILVAQRLLNSAT